MVLASEGQPQHSVWRCYLRHGSFHAGAVVALLLVLDLLEAEELLTLQLVQLALRAPKPTPSSKQARMELLRGTQHTLYSPLPTTSFKRYQPLQLINFRMQACHCAGHPARHSISIGIRQAAGYENGSAE